MREAPVSVLLVDDNAIFRNMAARYLVTLPGVQLAGTASGGEDGLRCAQELHPDLIVVDLRMRDAHGLDLIPRLRALMPSAGIIALSLLDPQGFRQVTLQAGADEFVDKMAMVNDLLPAIRKVTSNLASWKFNQSAVTAA